MGFSYFTCNSLIMKTLYKHSIRIMAGFILMIMVLPLFGQPGTEPVAISPIIGPKLDNQEYTKFKLYDFHRINRRDFDYAEFYPSENDTHIFRIYETNGAHYDIVLTPAQMENLIEKINFEGRYLLEVLERIKISLNKNEQPLLRIMTEDGTRVNGPVVGMTQSEIQLNSQMGLLQIKIEDLESVEWEGIDFEPDTRYGFVNPNSTRYLFAPSAIPMKRGEGYYQNVWVTLNSLNYGLTDNISITGGIELITLFTTMSFGDPGVLSFANIKVGTQVKEKLYLGGGILGGGVIGENDANGGIGYGLLTYGNKENNITLGIGYGYLAGDWANRPIVVISAMKRVSSKVALVTENWIVSTHSEYSYQDYYTGRQETSIHNDTYPVLSGAFRIMSENITFDLGLITAGEIYSSKTKSAEGNTISNYSGTDWVPIPIPYLDFVYKF